MKNIMWLLCIVVLMAFTGEKWQEFKSYDGKFRVLVPGDMVEKQSKVTTDIGELVFHQYIYQPADKNADNVFYLVNYCDYPEGTFPPDSTNLIQEFLETTVTESENSVGGKVLYSSDIQLQTYKGKIWRVQYNNERAIIKSKCYLVKDRFYLIQTMTLKEKSLNPSVDKFLDSFYVF